VLKAHALNLGAILPYCSRLRKCTKTLSPVLYGRLRAFEASPRVQTVSGLENQDVDATLTVGEHQHGRSS
jgi:hypothetical protein